MGVTVMVNQRTVVHRHSGGEAIVGAPDFCKTPPNAAPIAYTNVAVSATGIAQGSKTVKCDGQSIMLKGSVFKTSSGDEGGTAGGGVASGVIKGKATFSNYSQNVKFEGKNVPRLGDPMLNNGNPYNSLTPAALNNPNFAEAIDLMCKEMCEVYDQLEGKLKRGQQYQRELSNRLKGNKKLANLGFKFEQRVWAITPKGTAAQWARNALKPDTIKRMAAKLGKKMLGGSVGDIGTKIVTRVGSKLVPFIGWASLALDVYEVISFIPDALQLIEDAGGMGKISRVFDFKFPNDSPRPGQYELGKRVTDGDNKEVIELTLEECDCPP